MRRLLGIGIAAAYLAVGGMGQSGARADDADRLDQHFNQARADLAAGSPKAARKQLGKAARQLEKKVYPANGEVEHALVKNAVALKSLSAEVKRGEVNTPQAIDPSAARAHAALAKFHQARAEEYWSRAKTERAGRDLLAAAHHLELGAAWLGLGVDNDVNMASQKAALIGQLLVAGTGYATQDVAGSIQAVGREIDRIGWRVDEGPSLGPQ